ncbi:ATP-dependent DNA ligase [Nakamurella sp. YIM 132087]|uniref:DNA ligase (ATP) n=1 Tax=Nakamurella alba TaxID=2665158 RepID=A0A7K1FNH7_9ACTN|nr:ATP-dependent DNA ligase [Nakamurella alba]MTD15721.1 ATP-dependent DNA ligase [Nakamurella alba]
MATDDAQVDMDGHLLKLTNLSKILYPATRTPKSEIIAYYAEVAVAMLPHIAGRPVTRKRWPNGTSAQPFFQKNVDHATPSWMQRQAIPHSSGDVIYPLVDSPAGLAWMGQNGALELHVPQWRFDADGSVGRPDRLVFDLDPGPGVTLADCAAVAKVLRDRLDLEGLQLFPVTSGAKGLHLYTHLADSMTSDEASAWAHELARSVEQEMPKQVTSKMTKSVRGGRVFIDWSQNNAAKTTIAPYSLRGRDRPTVATPRTWDELDDPDLQHLDYREVLRRLDSQGDLLADLDPGPGRKTRRKARTATKEKPAEKPKPDKLATYRSMRSADRTPEPVPTENADLPQGNDDTFVIQEHHARALHWDFRLEHDGVLVSWALPKGIPTDGSHNRLAVHTEDHPMEYADFAGRIPRAEYGGGRVLIWDHGTYETEKWRDSEVIVTLHGERAKGRFALIRTKDKNWLMHRTKDQEALPPVVAMTNAEMDEIIDAAGPLDDDGKVTHEPAGTDDEPPPPPPDDLRPMLATAGRPQDVADPEQWRYEGKWDGIRAMAEVGPDVLRLTSRTGRNITAVYPELAELTDLLHGHSAVLDGEIVALDAKGRTDFGLMQNRMNVAKAAEIARLSQEQPVRYHVFDVLFLDGVSLLRRGYDLRRQVLQAMPLDGEFVTVPDALDGDVQQALARSRELDWEGVIAKKSDSVYQSGKRVHTWIKIKNQRMQEVVIVGWRPGAGRREGSLGALLLGIPEVGDDGKPGWRYVGRVGTGFTDAMLDDLMRRLKPLARKTTPITGDLPREETRDARWVRPELVGEVRFTEWTRDGVVRQAAWRGLRPDKQAADVVLES